MRLEKGFYPLSCELGLCRGRGDYVIKFNNLAHGSFIYICESCAKELKGLLCGVTGGCKCKPERKARTRSAPDKSESVASRARKKSICEKCKNALESEAVKEALKSEAPLKKLPTAEAPTKVKASKKRGKIDE